MKQKPLRCGREAAPASGWSRRWRKNSPLRPYLFSAAQRPQNKARKTTEYGTQADPPKQKVAPPYIRTDNTPRKDASKVSCTGVLAAVSRKTRKKQPSNGTSADPQKMRDICFVSNATRNWNWRSLVKRFVKCSRIRPQPNENALIYARKEPCVL